MTTLMDAAISIGSTKRLVHVFERPDPVPTAFDPTGVQLRTKAPTGTEISWPVRRTALGTYQADVFVGIPGQWRYRWQSADPAYSQHGSFLVSNFYGDFLPETPETDPLGHPPYTWNELAPYTWNQLADHTWNELGGIAITDTFTFQQTVASSSWVINHNLGRYPAVNVEDTNGNPVLIVPDYQGPNTVVINFNPPMAGVAYLN